MCIRDRYSLEATLVSTNGTALHRVSRTFGVRKFEVQGGGFQLNGERVRLMGVERMAGSNPDYGMAEPAEWIEHDHADMKNLNCVFTRVHWQQDRRAVSYTHLKNYFGKYLAIVAEIPDTEVTDSTGVAAGTPEFFKARETYVAARLDGRIKKPIVPEPEPEPIQQPRGPFARSARPKQV